MNRLEFASRLSAPAGLQDFSRNTKNNHTFRNIPGNHGVGADYAPGPDFDRPQHGRPNSEGDAIPDPRMSAPGRVHTVEVSPKSYVLPYIAVGTNEGVIADHDTSYMSDQKPWTDIRNKADPAMAGVTHDALNPALDNALYK